jgi:hypothetical protein
MTKIEKLNLTVRTLRIAKDALTGRISSLKDETAMYFRYMEDDPYDKDRFEDVIESLGNAVGALSHLDTIIFEYCDKVEEAKAQQEGTKV